MATTSDRIDLSLRARVETHAHRLREVAIALQTTADTSTFMMPATKRLLREWGGLLLSTSEELTWVVSDEATKLTGPAATARNVKVLNKLGRAAMAGLLVFAGSVGDTVSKEVSDLADELGISERIAEAVLDADQSSQQLDDALAERPPAGLVALRALLDKALQEHVHDPDFAWSVNEEDVTVSESDGALDFMADGPGYGFYVPLDKVHVDGIDLVAEGLAALDRIRPVPMPAVQPNEDE